MPKRRKAAFRVSDRTLSKSPSRHPRQNFDQCGTTRNLPCVLSIGNREKDEHRTSKEEGGKVERGTSKEEGRTPNVEGGTSKVEGGKVER